MNVTLHDFSGHPFQAELSRKLAESGHRVSHVSSVQYVSGKGHLEREEEDSASLTFAEISLPLEFKKYSPLARFKFEWRYGRTWIKQLKADPPDVVIACNLPLISMFLFARYARRAKLPYVLWHQDIYSAGIGDELRRKLPRPLASLGSKLFAQMEAYCARNASHVVAIGDAFIEFYQAWSVAPQHVSVIPNWAPLDKVFPVERNNRQSARLFDDEHSLRLVYAGTLGRKHNPQLLIELLQMALENDIPASLVVISEGDAADDLAKAGTTDGLPLRVLPFQPADNLSDVLGSADVLVALLEPQATTFSIPSKVLSYMAAGRPILGLMPRDNPAAADIIATGGQVASPSSEGVRESLEWLRSLHSDAAQVAAVGKQSRAVAEQKFDVAKVAHQFHSILEAARRR